MGLLIDLAWKSVLIAGMALLAHATMRGRPAAERAFLLQAALVALLALPLLVLVLPVFDLAWLPALPASPAMPVAVPPHLTSLDMVATVTPVVASVRTGVVDIAISLYGLGVAVLLLRFLAGLLTLAFWTRGARPAIDPHWQRTMDRETAEFRRPLRLLVTPRAVTPLSWGVVPAWILIGPATHDRPEQAEAVIAHELAHIRRCDWLGLVLTRIVTAMFWFNPLVWLVARDLMREAELAADADALGRVDRYDYAQALLAVAGGGVAHRDANGMAFTRTALARRITTVLESGSGRRVRPLVPAFLLLALLGAAGPLAAARIVRAEAVTRLPVTQTAPNSRYPASADPTTSSWPAAVKAAGRSAGAALKSFGGGIKATLSSRRSTPSAALDPRSTAAAPVVEVSRTGMRIIGQAGAQVISGPDGIAIVGGGPEDEGAAEARRGAEEARKGKIDGMRGAADGFRSSAEELERGAKDPGLLAGTREKLLSNARNLRARASAIDDQVKTLTGG